MSLIEIHAHLSTCTIISRQLRLFISLSVVQIRSHIGCINAYYIIGIYTHIESITIISSYIECHCIGFLYYFAVNQ